MEEDVLIGVVLPLVGNETILCREEGWEGREKGEKGGKTRNRDRERREEEYNCVTEQPINSTASC